MALTRSKTVTEGLEELVNTSANGKGHTEHEQMDGRDGVGTDTSTGSQTRTKTGSSRPVTGTQGLQSKGTQSSTRIRVGSMRSDRVATLNMSVLRADGLPLSHANGEPDPYVKLIYCLRQSESSSAFEDQRVLMGQTTCKPSTFSPEWNEDFSHTFKTSEGFNARLLRGIYIICEVWDKEKMSSDDFLGSTRVFVPANRDESTPSELWYPLVKPDNVSGSVLLRIQWACTPFPMPSSTSDPSSSSSSENDSNLTTQHKRHLFREECPPSLPSFSSLYEETRVNNLIISMPPADEVLLIHLDETKLKDEIGSLYLTNFRVVFVPDRIVKTSLSPTGTASRRVALSFALGAVARCHPDTETLSLRIDCKDFKRYVFKACVSQGTNPLLVEAIQNKLLRYHDEIGWRMSEGCWCFSMCEHSLPHLRRVSGFPQSDMIETENAKVTFAAGCSHRGRRTLVLEQSPSKAESFQIPSERKNQKSRLEKEYARLGITTGTSTPFTSATASPTSSPTASTSSADFVCLESDKDAWCISAANDNYEMCETYPSLLVLPARLDTDMITKAASVRSKKRLPALTWIHPLTKAALCRSAQPLSGFTQRKLEGDIEMLSSIRATSSRGDDAILRIFDARPKINAEANALGGKGGYECIAHLGGSDVATLTFCGIGNIHTMRNSLLGLTAACSAFPTPSDFWSLLCNSKWLEHIELLLASSLKIAHALQVGNPVLVHCSDGWDRTSQLCATAQLLLDPYYRTFDGFATLVEKDWSGFGHKFATRLRGSGKRYDEHDNSPVFLQWLDVVYQLWYQNPERFEFSSAYLCYIAEAAYSQWYGTFMCDSEKQRVSEGIEVIT